MNRFFKRTLVAGMPWSTPGLIEGIAKMAEMLSELDCQPGTVRFYNNDRRAVIFPDATGGGDDVQFFKITAVGETALTAVHMVLNDEDTWVEGSLGTGIEIAPYPDSTIANYLVDAYIIAIDATEGWIAATNPLPKGATTGDLMYWDNDDKEYKSLPVPANKSVLIYDPDKASGLKLYWAQVASFSCPT